MASGEPGKYNINYYRNYDINDNTFYTETNTTLAPSIEDLG